MKRWFVRVVAGLLSAVIIIGVLAWLTLRASLPELDGEIAADGTAEELLERSGCNSLEDAFVALIGSEEGLLA